MKHDFTIKLSLVCSFSGLKSQCNLVFVCVTIQFSSLLGVRGVWSRIDRETSFSVQNPSFFIFWCSVLSSAFFGISGYKVVQLCKFFCSYHWCVCVACSQSHGLSLNLEFIDSALLTASKPQEPFCLHLPHTEILGQVSANVSRYFLRVSVSLN